MRSSLGFRGQFWISGSVAESGGGFGIPSRVLDSCRVLDSGGVFGSWGRVLDSCWGFGFVVGALDL